ncbi:hypothetical protein pb186bvf_005362 [Paramecium bursaria]
MFDIFYYLGLTFILYWVYQALKVIYKSLNIFKNTKLTYGKDFWAIVTDGLGKVFVEIVAKQNVNVIGINKRKSKTSTSKLRIVIADFAKSQEKGFFEAIINVGISHVTQLDKLQDKHILDVIVVNCFPQLFSQGHYCQSQFLERNRKYQMFPHFLAFTPYLLTLLSFEIPKNVEGLPNSIGLKQNLQNCKEQIETMSQYYCFWNENSNGNFKGKCVGGKLMKCSDANRNSNITFLCSLSRIPILQLKGDFKQMKIIKESVWLAFIIRTNQRAITKIQQQINDKQDIKLKLKVRKQERTQINMNENKTSMNEVIEYRRSGSQERKIEKLLKMINRDAKQTFRLVIMKIKQVLINYYQCHIQGEVIVNIDLKSLLMQQPQKIQRQRHQPSRILCDTFQIIINNIRMISIMYSSQIKQRINSAQLYGDGAHQIISLLKIDSIEVSLCLLNLKCNSLLFKQLINRIFNQKSEDNIRGFLEYCRTGYSNKHITDYIRETSIQQQFTIKLQEYKNKRKLENTQIIQQKYKISRLQISKYPYYIYKCKIKRDQPKIYRISKNVTKQDMNNGRKQLQQTYRARG